MFAQAVQYPTTYNLTDGIFGTWGNPVSSPLNADVLRNIRSLGASDFFNYPTQRNGNYVINNTLGGRGMPMIGYGLDTLAGLQTALGLAAINGGLLNTVTPFGFEGNYPVNAFGLGQVIPGVNLPSMPSIWNHIYGSLNGIHGVPANNLFGGINGLQGQTLFGGLNNINGQFGAPYFGGFNGYTGNSLPTGNWGTNLGPSMYPTTAFGGGFPQSIGGFESQAMLQSISGFGQVNYLDNNSEIIFECAVPGIVSSNIDVSVVQDQIRVRLIPTTATGTRATNPNGRSNPTAGAPIYTLPVPTFSDVSKISARVEHGRLFITIPRTTDYQRNITRVKVS